MKELCRHNEDGELMENRIQVTVSPKCSRYLYGGLKVKNSLPPEPQQKSKLMKTLNSPGITNPDKKDQNTINNRGS